MAAYQFAMFLTALLCSLVAGFLFAFAVVVMPGLKKLDDAAFIRAFQVIDGVIQKNQPIFVIVWLGSILAVVTSSVLGLWALTGWHLALQVLVLLVYLLGVQLPTFAINIPMNNRLQALSIEGLNAAALYAARAPFEHRWNRWNRFRAVLCALVTAALLVLMAASAGG